MSGREQTTTGMDAHVAAALAYLAGPFSGLLVLLAERTSTNVRFHAWQAILGLGGLGAVVVLLVGLAFASLLVSAAAFRGLMVAAAATAVLWTVCWIVCVVQAFRRRRWKLPVAGTWAERLSAR